MIGGQSTRESRESQEARGPSRDRFALQVRDGLSHLQDLAYLETHPLTRCLQKDRSAKKASLGPTLREALLDALESLHPGGEATGHARHWRLLQFRYVEELDVREVYDQLAISRTEFYRQHGRAIKAIASILRSRWGIVEAADDEDEGRRAAWSGTDQGEHEPQAIAKAARPPHNLPLQLTNFVGREREMADVRRLLGTTRLLTLTGTGGCGKTRLALQVAPQVLDEYPDGVWLVDLAALVDPLLVSQTVATTLGLREEPGHPILEMLAKYLRPRRMLLLLDNCEHLLQACGELVDHLLRGCADLSVLAISREALGVAGEVNYRVPSLAAPQPHEHVPPDQLARYEAVRLFLDRASSIRPGFALTEQNAPAIAQVCWRLDGIPLAIELAAARVKILAVEQIAARLDDRFRLLTGGVRTALPRQQTLKAAIDWSYGPLTEVEKKVFRRLAVFAGDCNLESAEEVCAGDGVDQLGVLDALSALSDKSLIVVVERPGENRYRLLETIRQYARDRLLESSETEAARDRHLEWFVSLAERVAQELGGFRQVEWLDRLEADHENLRAALEWALAGRFDRGLRLGGSLWLFWRVRGYLAEGRRWLEALLAKALGPSVARAEALLGLGIITADLGDYALAQARCVASLADFRKLGDRRGVGRALRHVGATWLYLGDHERAEPLLDESLAILEEVGDERDIAWTLRYLGVHQTAQYGFSHGRASFERCLELLRRVGDKHALAWALQHLAAEAIGQDRSDADLLVEEELAVAREVGDRRAVGASLIQLATLALRRGDLVRARRLMEQGRALCWETGYSQGVAGALTGQAYLARMEADAVRARAVLRECLEMMAPGRATVAGGDPVALAGLLAADRGDYKSGVRLVASSGLDVSRPWLTSVLVAGLIDEFRASLAAARSALGEQAFAQAWSEGQAMGLEEAVELALGLGDG